MLVMTLLLRGVLIVVVLGWGAAEEVDMETARMVVVDDAVSKSEQSQGLEGKQMYSDLFALLPRFRCRLGAAT